MPELPEVETIARGLRATVLGRRVVDVRLARGDRVRPGPAAFQAALIERAIDRVDRHGKLLLLGLEAGWTLAVHLRMTGQLRLCEADEPARPHTHLWLELDDGRELRWRDVRRFGWLHALPTAELPALPARAAMGPDALAVDAATFSARVRAVRRRLKPLLLAQDQVAGVGNIYADELLWRARIHPLQRADLLSEARAARLHAAMIATLEAAIAARGSSIDGEYVALDGYQGEYQLQHAVYGRAGQPAPCCGRPVRRIVLGGRSTCFCPRCQKKVGP